MGLTNYFRGSIRDYAELVFPVTELLGRYKPEKLKWGEEQQNAFVALKKALTVKPVVYPPNQNKDYRIMADASERSLSGILLRTGTMKTTLLGSCPTPAEN